MKKNYYIFFLSILILGCGNRYEGFNMTYRKDFPKAIPAGSSTFLTHYFVIEDIAPKFQIQADNSATNIAEVIKIVPRAFRLSSRFGDTDFGFVREVIVNIYPRNEPQKKTEVFYRVDIPVNTGPVLILNPGLADVKSIMSNDNNTYDMEIRMLFRGIPQNNIETFIDYSFTAVTKE